MIYDIWYIIYYISHIWYYIYRIYIIYYIHYIYTLYIIYFIFYNIFNIFHIIYYVIYIHIQLHDVKGRALSIDIDWQGHRSSGWLPRGSKQDSMQLASHERCLVPQFSWGLSSTGNSFLKKPKRRRFRVFNFTRGWNEGFSLNFPTTPYLFHSCSVQMSWNTCDFQLVTIAGILLWDVSRDCPSYST
jgi:hypothetical protein